MQKHRWLEEIISDIVVYCEDNGLDCTKQMLSAAGNILMSESDASEIPERIALSLTTESKEQKIH